MEHRLSATLELKDQFTTKIHSAAKGMSAFEENIKQMGSVFSKTIHKMNIDADKIKGVQSKLTNFAKNSMVGLVTGTTAIGAVFRSAYLEQAELGDALTRNAAMARATKEEQKALEEQVKNLGRTTSFTAKQIAEAHKYEIMAGYKPETVLKITPKLLDFSIATGEDLASASDIITDNLDAFGLKIEEVDRLLDVMSSTATNTNTNVSMLGEAYKYVAPTSKEFDSFEEINIMLGILANNGIKAGQAGRNLAGIYTRLSNPSQEMLKMMVKTNTTLYDKQGHFKGLRKIIEETRPKLERLTDAERNQWLATVVGAEGLKIWNSIMNYSVEGTKNVEKAVYNASGSLKYMNDVMKNTDRRKIDALTSAWEGFKIKLGEGLSPLVNENMEKLTNFLNNLTDSNALETENLNKFFKEISSNAKTAAGAFLAAQIAFLSWRASMGDPLAIGQLGTLAAAGVALGVYKGMQYRTESEKEEIAKKYNPGGEELPFFTTNKNPKQNNNRLVLQKYSNNQEFPFQNLLNNFVKRDKTDANKLLSKTYLKEKKLSKNNYNFKEKRQFNLTEPIKIDIGFKNELSINNTTDIDKIVKMTTEEFSNQFSKKLRLAAATTQ